MRQLKSTYTYLNIHMLCISTRAYTRIYAYIYVLHMLYVLRMLHVLHIYIYIYIYIYARYDSSKFFFDILYTFNYTRC
jgi:hypothetical protein